MPELDHPSMPAIDVEEHQPLLDSSNMTPAEWMGIASSIVRQYESYDAFVILHGTDTMAYTASALSFVLENLGKTVIMTGAQIPLCEIRSDGRDNLVTSLLVAASDAIPEVCVYFGQRLLRGNRCRKVDANGLQAFDSPNYPLLGASGTSLTLHRSRARAAPSEPLRFQRISHPYVGEMRLFPGITASVVRNFLQPPLEGLVIETYGVGNAPNRDPELLRVLREASDRGVVIVSCTQCIKGAVDMENYETGKSLRGTGVIPGLDMTPEAALTKLYYLLSLELPPDEVRRLMQTDLRGELTAVVP